MQTEEKQPPLDEFERTTLWIVAVLFVFVSATTLFAGKVRDLSSVVGVRDNQLIGYGLVVGLAGTGDGSSSTFTVQSLANMLQTVNIKVGQDDIASENVAAVMVTATLRPFTRSGDQLDVVVSSIGDAESLEGGTLLMTPLKGIDGKIYAVTQGAITIGGMNSGGGGGQKNHATVGKVLGGATVERSMTYDIYNKEYATLSLKSTSFENAVAIQDAINQAFDVKVAVAIDPGAVRLKRPADMNMVEFLARIGDVEASVSVPKKVIVDERTGTVIAGIDIEIHPVMITHGEITLAVDQALLENGGKLTVANVTQALQKLGATPKDVIAIFQAIKRAGALDASLEII